MRKIKDVLRLKYDAKLSCRQIAASCPMNIEFLRKNRHLFAPLPWIFVEIIFAVGSNSIRYYIAGSFLMLALVFYLALKPQAKK